STSIRTAGRVSLCADFPASMRALTFQFASLLRSRESTHTAPRQVATGITTLMRGHVRLTLRGAAG
ncbi:MAG TPA: hypothetical protein VGP84_13070, partial [Gemmatimonadaceae bacterium]|nr:hypothetical protein [Gemmatimonadaceae bacterium]